MSIVSIGLRFYISFLRNYWVDFIGILYGYVVYGPILGKYFWGDRSTMALTFETKHVSPLGSCTKVNLLYLQKFLAYSLHI